MTGGAYSRIRSFLYLLFFRSSHFFEIEKFESFSKRFFESSIWARSWLYRRHKFQIFKCSWNATVEMTPFRGRLFSQQFFHSCLTCPRGCSGQGATVARHPSDRARRWDVPFLTVVDGCFHFSIFVLLFPVFPTSLKLRAKKNKFWIIHRSPAIISNLSQFRQHTWKTNRKIIVLGNFKALRIHANSPTYFKHFMQYFSNF